MSDVEWLTEEFWDERYRTHDRVWSGRPNPRLVEQAEALPPGRALDVGCGEGADVVWLAKRGWTVVGVDISSVALEKAAVHAEDEGVAERTSWERHDVLAWDGPEPGSFDLVSSQYAHLPAAPRAEVIGRLAAAVRPGGTLLVVGHHPSDLHAGVGRTGDVGAMPTGEELAELVDPADWAVHAEDPFREVDGPHGRATVQDAVLVARRRTD